MITKAKQSTIIFHIEILRSLIAWQQRAFELKLRSGSVPAALCHQLVENRSKGLALLQRQPVSDVMKACLQRRLMSACTYKYMHLCMQAPEVQNHTRPTWDYALSEQIQHASEQHTFVQETLK